MGRHHGLRAYSMAYGPTAWPMGLQHGLQAYSMACRPTAWPITSHVQIAELGCQRAELKPRAWLFQCAAWIATDEGDGVTSKVLTATAADHIDALRMLPSNNEPSTERTEQSSASSSSWWWSRDKASTDSMTHSSAGSDAQQENSSVEQSSLDAEPADEALTKAAEPQTSPPTPWWRRKSSSALT